MVRIRLLIALPLFLAFPVVASAQYATDYVPLKNVGPIPEDFIADPIEKTTKDIASQSVLDEKQAHVFYSKVNFLERQIFQSGNLYLNNTVTTYVDSVMAKLLALSPTLPGPVKVYVTRFTEPNAFCFPDGRIIVNIGLLDVLQDEAELAFILAHELGHFVESHSIKDLKRMTDIELRESNANTEESSAYRGLQFSRDSEFDADFWALQLAHQAGYDLASSINALNRLKEEEPDTMRKLALDNIFNSEYFTLDTSWVNEKAVKKQIRKFERKDDGSVATGNLDDLFQTHPDIDKRVEALTAMAKTLNKTGSATSASAKDKIDRVTLIARFEQVENLSKKQRYVEALEQSLLLQKQYPENAYLRTVVARSLYWISYYKEINSGEVTVPHARESSTQDLKVLVAFFNEMGLSDAKKLAYSYAKVLEEKGDATESISFHLALSTENYLGKNLAKVQYQDYLLKHPMGTHVNFVKSRMQ